MDSLHFISNGENPNPPSAGGCRCSTKKDGSRSVITLTKRHHPPLCPHRGENHNHNNSRQQNHLRQQAKGKANTDRRHIQGMS